MGAGPRLNPDVKRRLREIDPHLNAEWDTKRDRWNIMYEPLGRPPYIILSVKNEDGSYRPIDGRTYQAIRESIAFSNDLIRNMRDMLEQDRMGQIRLDEKEKQRYREIAYEFRRPIQMLGRELGVLPGKARIPYSPGWSG